MFKVGTALKGGKKGEEVVMLIKAGVDISRLNREIRRTLTPMEAFMQGFNKELTITSTYEGNHMAGSLHYSNDAYDCSRPMAVEDREKIRVKKLLGDHFDVVFYKGIIHIEFDPNRFDVPRSK